MEQEELGAVNQSRLRRIFTGFQEAARNWMTVAIFAVFTVLFFSLISIVILGYIHTWKWTGVVGKTFWDWLKLMIVPIVLGAGGYSVVRAFAWSDQLGQQQRTQEAMRAAQDTSRQASLDQISLAYIDRMEAFLVDPERPLGRSQPGDQLQTLTRARTLNVLEALDSRRRGSIIRFLYEAGLISRDRPIIQLSGANLIGANLSGAVPRYATLWKANLSRANLNGADLQGAGLEGADLSNASGITNEDLKRQTFRLQGATMPDGQEYEDWLKGRGEDGENSGPS